MKERTNIEIPLRPKEKPLARAYVPDQCFQGIMEPQAALEKGTAFEELSMPYLPKKTAGYK